MTDARQVAQITDRMLERVGDLPDHVARILARDVVLPMLAAAWDEGSYAPYPANLNRNPYRQEAETGQREKPLQPYEDSFNDTPDDDPQDPTYCRRCDSNHAWSHQ